MCSSLIWECIASRWIVLRRRILMASETDSACLPEHATGSFGFQALEDRDSRGFVSRRVRRSYAMNRRAETLRLCFLASLAAFFFVDSVLIY